MAKYSGSDRVKRLFKRLFKRFLKRPFKRLGRPGRPWKVKLLINGQVWKKKKKKRRTQTVTWSAELRSRSKSQIGAQTKKFLASLNFFSASFALASAYRSSQ